MAKIVIVIPVCYIKLSQSVTYYPSETPQMPLRGFNLHKCYLRNAMKVYSSHVLPITSPGCVCKCV